MSDFGNALRAAREAKGLTIKDLAQKTRILGITLEGLENDDYSHIPAPIYGRGFVKICCETLGIADPKPMIAAFMSIYDDVKNGRPIASAPAPAQAAVPPPAPAPIAEPPKPEPIPAPIPAPVPPPAPAPAPIAEPPKPAPIPTPIPTPVPIAEQPKPIAAEPPPAVINFGESDFHLESETIQRPRPVAGRPAEKPVEKPVQRFNPPSAMRRPQSRFDRTPKGMNRRRVSVPPMVWRVGLLAIVGFAIVWLAASGVNALRKATMNDNGRETRQIAATPAGAPSVAKASSPAGAPLPAKASTPAGAPLLAKASSAASPAKPRVPQKIDPLYID